MHESCFPCKQSNFRRSCCKFVAPVAFALLLPVLLCSKVEGCRIDSKEEKPFQRYVCLSLFNHHPELVVQPGLMKRHMMKQMSQP